MPPRHRSRLMYRRSRLSLVIKMLIDKVFLQTISKLTVLTCHHRIHSRTVLFNQSTQLMHLSAIIIKHLLIKHARTETIARFLKTSRPEQGSDSFSWRKNRDATPQELPFPRYLPLSYYTSQTKATSAKI